MGVVGSTRVIIYFNLNFCAKFTWLILCIVQLIYHFLVFHHLLLYHINIILHALFLAYYNPAVCGLRMYVFLLYFCIKYFFFCFPFNCLCIIIWWTSWDVYSFITNLIANQITSFLFSVFWIDLFEIFSSASAADCLAWSRSYRLNLPLTFLLIFAYIFLAKEKNP